MIYITDKSIHIRQAVKTGYIEIFYDDLPGVVDLSFPTSKLRRGRVQMGGGISPTVTTTGGLFVFEKIERKVNSKMAELIKKIADETLAFLMRCFRIRKLTPTECFVLQGMEKLDVYKGKNIKISDSQLYKIAGNGLTTNCVQFLCERLWKSYNPDYITTDEKMVEEYGEL